MYLVHNSDTRRNTGLNLNTQQTSQLERMKFEWIYASLFGPLSVTSRAVLCNFCWCIFMKPPDVSYLDRTLLYWAFGMFYMNFMWQFIHILCDNLVIFCLSTLVKMVQWFIPANMMKWAQKFKKRTKYTLMLQIDFEQISMHAFVRTARCRLMIIFQDSKYTKFLE